MKVGFKTYTGSKYLLDYDAKIWNRVSGTEHSGKLRTESGEMLNVPRVNLGEIVIIETTPINWPIRLIVTSAVVQIDTLPDVGERWLEDS